MASNIDYFNKYELLKIIGRKLKKNADLKGITITEWSELYEDGNGKKGIAQGDLSNILNGRKGVSNEKLIQIALAIGVSQKELDKIVAESKIDELRIFYGNDFEYDIDNKKLELLKEFDTETLELLKDLDFDADFLKNIKLSVKGKNKDRLKEDLIKIFRHYQRLGELDDE